MLNLDVYFECERSIKIARLGYLLANGGLDRDDANWIIHEIQETAGWFPIEELSIGSVIEQAEQYWQPHPAIPDLAAQACRRVWNKWSSTGDVQSAAEDWAIDLIGEYAAEDGIELILASEAEPAL